MITFETLSKTILISSLTLFLSIFAQKKTDRFTISAITPTHDYSHLNFSSSISKEASEALNQPYRYFVSGGQTFVFLSADGKYVLKLLKQKLYHPSWWLNHLPLPSFLHRYREKRNFKRFDKWNRDFFSYTHAYNDLNKESGLVYCHLGKSFNLNQTLTLTDRLHIQHKLNLDQIDFIIQKKAETVAERLSRIKEEPEEVRTLFQQILAITQTCIDKGLYNRDPFIPHNCGFIGDQPIQIDVGRFLKREGQNPANEMKRITKPFKKWLEVYFPDLAPLFKQEATQ